MSGKCVQTVDMFRSRGIDIPLYSPAKKVMVYEHLHEGEWLRIPFDVYCDLDSGNSSECRMYLEDRPALMRCKDVKRAIYQAGVRGAAAAELAKVLEAMVERFGHEIFTMPKADRDLLTRAVDALAKAKGEGA